jgi:hypothetical protein
MASTDRMLRLTARGEAAARGPLVLFRAPCSGCRSVVDVTRYGPYSGPATHSAAFCASVAKLRKLVAA